jgi:hypothetical protein
MPHGWACAKPAAGISGATARDITHGRSKAWHVHTKSASSLRIGDVMNPATGKPEWIHPPERVHDIPTADGRLLLRHYVFRTTDGSKACPYKSRRKPGWVWNWTTNFLPDDVDANDLLYRLPELLEAFGGGAARIIYWTEGEKDCKTMVEKFGVVATSHHQGATHATPGQAAWLERFGGTIVLVADWDVAGCADALRRYALLRAVGIRTDQLRVVRGRASRGRPPLAHGKDVTDHVKAGFGLDDLVSLSVETLQRHARRFAPKVRVVRATEPGEMGGCSGARACLTKRLPRMVGPGRRGVNLSLTPRGVLGGRVTVSLPERWHRHVCELEAPSRQTGGG